MAIQAQCMPIPRPRRRRLPSRNSRVHRQHDYQVAHTLETRGRCDDNPVEDARLCSLMRVHRDPCPCPHVRFAHIHIADGSSIHHGDLPALHDWDISVILEALKGCYPLVHGKNVCG